MRYFDVKLPGFAFELGSRRFGNQANGTVSFEEKGRGLTKRPPHPTPALTNTRERVFSRAPKAFNYLNPGSENSLHVSAKKRCEKLLPY